MTTFVVIMRFSYKQIWLIAYPILFSLLMEHMIGMTDTAFLGRVGEVELGASALAGVYYLAIFMLGFGFSLGVQILIGRRNGEGRYGEIGAIFMQGTLFLLALAAVMFSISKIWSPVVLRTLIASDQVYEATIRYMDWRVYGFFFSFTALMFRAFFVGTANTKTLTLNSVVMVSTNVVLNYILIFGKFGFPAWGIAGAAIASSISELVSLLFFVVYTCVRVDLKKYNLFKAFHFNLKLLGQVLNISIWTMIQAFISISSWFLFFIAVEHLGERSLAITNILRSISSLFFIIVSAFATTASSLVSNLIGAGLQGQVLGVCKKVIKMCYLIILPLMLLMAVFPTAVMRIYTDNLSLIDSSIPSFFVMLSVYLISVPANVLFNTVSGTGNTRSALLMEFIALIIYTLYVIYVVIYLKANLAICWTTEYVYLVMMLTLAYFYLTKANWQNKKI